MTITIDYGYINGEPETIRNVIGIYGIDNSDIVDDVIIFYLSDDGKIVKGKKLMYTDYVTITIH